MELSMAIDEISDNMKSNPKIINPLIMGYVNNYKAVLPTESRKKPTTRRNLLDTAVLKMLKQISMFKTHKSDGVSIDLFRMVEKNQPAVLLLRRLNKFKNLKRVILVSHNPLDFHIFRYLKKGIILESFTGKLINPSPKDLGIKVFNDPEIPFYPATHAMLGDKDIIQCPFLTRKEKTRFKELAYDKKWKLSTNAKIESDIRNNGFRLPFRIFVS
jgi:hypothetical protein